MRGGVQVYMSGDAIPVPIDVLLAHRSWVSRVARALAKDAAAAEDIEQDVWVKAIGCGPVESGSARAWLRTVLRRTARDHWRRETRRQAREATQLPQAVTPGVGEMVRHAESLRQVVDAVVALDEPYRSTVLLRYWEDLPPREVARIQRVPVETVRTRTRRALARLRESLDADRRGGWIAVVGPLACGPDAGSAGVASLGTMNAGIAGGIAMGTKSLLGGVAIGAVVGALTTTLMGAGGERSMPTGEPGATHEALSALRARVDDLEASPGPVLTPREPPDDPAAIGAHEERIAALELELRMTKARIAALAVDTTEVAAERPDFADLDTPALLDAIRKMVAKRSPPVDSEGILSATEILLARAIEDDQRAEALIMRGIGLRSRGDADAEREAFREALRISGADSSRGREARAQIAWTDAGNGRPLDVAAGFIEVAEHPSARKVERAWHRYHAGTQFEKSGDSRRARVEYQRVVDDHGDADDFGSKRVVGLARSALERLDGAR